VDRVEVLAKPSVTTLRLMRMRVQLDCYAATYAQAKALGTAVKAAIYSWQDGDAGVVECRVLDENDAGDDEETVHRVQLDASIMYNE
jgi:hypothetical protein